MNKRPRSESAARDPTSVVSIDVCGTNFRATRSTLGTLGILPEDNYPSDALFVDIEPEIFKVLLRCARHGYVLLVPPPSLNMTKREWHFVLRQFGLKIGPESDNSPPIIPLPCKGTLAGRRDEVFNGFVKDLAHWIKKCEPVRRAVIFAAEQVEFAFTHGIVYPRHEDGSAVSYIDATRWIKDNCGADCGCSPCRPNFTGYVREHLGVRRLEFQTVENVGEAPLLCSDGQLWDPRANPNKLRGAIPPPYTLVKISF